MRRTFVGQFDLSRLSQAVRVRKAGAASRSKDSERVQGSLRENRNRFEMLDSDPSKIPINAARRTVLSAY